MVYLFIFLAALSFGTIAVHAGRRNGHGMTYAAACFAVWIVAALWWSGRLG